MHMLILPVMLGVGASFPGNRDESTPRESDTKLAFALVVEEDGGAEPDVALASSAHNNDEDGSYGSRKRICLTALLASILLVVAIISLATVLPKSHSNTVRNHDAGEGNTPSIESIDTHLLGQVTHTPSDEKNWGSETFPPSYSPSQTATTEPSHSQVTGRPSIELSGMPSATKRRDFFLFSGQSNVRDLIRGRIFIFTRIAHTQCATDDRAHYRAYVDRKKRTVLGENQIFT